MKVPERIFSVSVYGAFGLRICEEPATAGTLGTLLTDPRWPWLVNRYEYYTPPPKSRLLKSKALTKQDGAATLAEGLLSPDRASLYMMNSPSQDEVRSSYVLSTGREASSQFETPYRFGLTQRGGTWPEHASIPKWIEVIHLIMATLRVSCGIVSGWDSWDRASEDTSMNSMRSSRDKLPEPYLSENRLTTMYSGTRLGANMVRPPRWGTYLAKHWVEQIGGTEAVERAAAPFLIRDCGGSVVYIQLTSSIEDSMSDECEQKRRALCKLMGPILPPGVTELL